MTVTENDPIHLTAIAKKGSNVALDLKPYDSSSYFKDNPSAQAELLADAIVAHDPGYLTHAIGVIARAHGMSELADKTGIKRQSLYRALSREGNPTIETVWAVLDALDLKLTITPKDAARELETAA